MLIMIAALCAVILCYLIVSEAAKRQADENNNQSGDGIIMLAEYKSRNVLSVEYTYNGETIGITKNSDALYLTGNQTFPLDQTVAGKMVSAVASIGCDRFVEESSENFSEYGLDNPCLSVTVSYDDNNTLTLNIGNYNQFTKNYYLNVGGTNKVYMVASAFLDFFKYGLYDLVLDDQLPSIEFETLTSLSAGTLSFKPDENSVWHEESAPDEDASERVKSLLESTMAITFDKCVAYGVKDDEARAPFGLDVPAYKIIVGYQVEEDVSGSETGLAGSTKKINKTLTVNVGSLTEDGNSRYISLEGSKLVYEVSADLFAGLEA